MNDIVAHESENPPATQGEQTLMNVIARAASDPSVDVDKLERLMSMYERVKSNEAEAAYDQEMSAAQEEMRPIAADANNLQTKSKYASYAALDRAIRPIYTKRGFSLSFGTGETELPDHVRVVCRVARSGHKEIVHLDMPCDGKGAKGGDVMTKTHAMGAAITYGKRYLLGMIFNLAVGDDDDGNARQDRGGSPAVQAAVAAINAANDMDGLKKWKTDNADGLKALPAADQDAVVRHFNTRYRKMKSGGAE